MAHSGTESLPRPHSSQWINNPTWDLTFISLSAVLVAIPFTVYFIPQLFGVDPDVSRNVVNATIAFLIGGPHMYATYSRTLLDPAFRERKRAVALSSGIIPLAVIYFGVSNFILLLTFFFFWASIHVLDQIVYLVDCYNERAPRPQSRLSRAIDYTLVMVAIYPFSVQKLVHDEFAIGSNILLFPSFLKHEWFVDIVFTVFIVAAIAYTFKTIREFARGEGHAPKTLLIVLTAGIAFLLPTFNNLDVAFQGFNTWHSFQYLGLTWYVNKLRRERGEPMSPFVKRISEGNGAWRYYAFVVGCTVLTIGVVVGIWSLTGFDKNHLDQCYYIPILSVLLTHYYHDHILFRHPEVLTRATTVI